MINGISGIAATEGPQEQLSDSIGGDKDLFLSLLVAQVRYQDPLEPMDNQEYLAQTAQFTMVEQMTKMAEQTTELLAFQRATLAAGMIGHTVTGVNELTGTTRGVVTGVDYNYGDPQLLVGDARIDLDEVIATEVADDPPADATADSGPDVSPAPAGGEEAPI